MAGQKDVVLEYFMCNFFCPAMSFFGGSAKVQVRGHVPLWRCGAVHLYRKMAVRHLVLCTTTLDAEVKSRRDDLFPNNLFLNGNTDPGNVYIPVSVFAYYSLVIEGG
jgi:hypothetical protein